MYKYNNIILYHAEMTRDIVKVIVSLCVVTAIVGGQSIRGQPRRFGGPSGNVDPSTPFQVSRQQQLSSRILGSQLWDGENPAPSQFDQFPLQSSSRFSMSPRTARLLAPYAAQTQRNLETFQQRNDQRQQNQMLQELQQQRQQRLQQLQNNRIQQSRSRFNMLRASNRQTQRSEMNTPVASSRIPLPSQQRGQRQQTWVSRGAPRLGFEENSLLSSSWNEELPQGTNQASLGSFPERKRITNPNLQQQIWQQRRINNMLRRQKNEKHRAEQLTMQSRQQEEKMHPLLLQEQQLKQHWHSQQPEVPDTNGADNATSLKLHETTSQQADMSHAQSVTPSVKALDQVQVKQERIHRLAALLGFKPSELVKAVAELEASKISFGTSTLTDPKANMLVNKIIPDVVSTTTSLNIGDVLPIFDSGVQKVMGDNVVKTQPLRNEIPPHPRQIILPHPPLLVTTEITSSATTYSPATTIKESASTTESSSTIAGTLSVAVHSVTDSPYASGASNITTGASMEAHNAGKQISDSHSTTDVQHLLHALLGPMASLRLLKDNAVSNATKTLLLQIQHLITNSNKTVHMDSNTTVHINGNSSNNVVIPHDNSVRFVNIPMTAQPETRGIPHDNSVRFVNTPTTAQPETRGIPHDNIMRFVNTPTTAQPETRGINNVRENGTTVAPVTMTTMGSEAWNITGDTTVEWNVTMTSPETTTMELNITTTVVTEATEAVPTAPPPPPGFPHMFEALPGQELTEAQLEYNEMREAMMAK